MANDAQDTTARIADAAGETASDLKDRAARTGERHQQVSAGMDAASEKAKQTIERAAPAKDAPAPPSQVIGENAALIGGLGMAIGAIIAAALPQTKAEAKVMGQASDSVKQAAGEAATNPDLRQPRMRRCRRPMRRQKAWPRPISAGTPAA